jgi:hypothetical protein
MYPSLFIGKFRQTCLQLWIRLCRRVCRSLHLNLNLNLDLDLNPPPFRKLFAKSFRLLFRTFIAALSGSLSESKNAWLRASPYLALRRQKLPRGRPLGRPIPGRIAARERCTTTYRRQSGPFLLPLLIEERVGVRSPAGSRLSRDRTCAQGRLQVRALAPELRDSRPP